MSKQITIDIRTFARLWDEVDTACMQFLSVEEGISDGDKQDEIEPWLKDGYASADYVRTLMERIAEDQGVTKDEMEELL